MLIAPDMLLREENHAKGNKSLFFHPVTMLPIAARP